jgi:hypothetical protein
VIQIVSLAGSFAHTSEDGVTTVSLGDVVDQLHDQDSLADAGTAEETDLSTLGVGGQKIDDLNTVENKIGLIFLKIKFATLQSRKILQMYD